MSKKKSEQIQGVRNALNRVCDGDKGHYVYALIDPRNNEVFYIGEGVGSRVLSHSEEWKAEEEEIDREYEQAINKADNKKSEERRTIIEEAKRERQSRKNSLNAKLDTIKAIEEDGCKVRHCIIKHGLTQQEGFWVESACINLLSFMEERNVGAKMLTNIVNGHATEKEKESRGRDKKTRMRELEDFLIECAPETVELSEKQSDAMKLDYDIVKKSIFINIKKSVDEDYRSNDYWDQARGNWGMAEGKANQIEYVFAMYASQVLDVYKVEKGRVKGFFSDDTSDAPVKADKRKEMKELLKKIKDKTKGLNVSEKEKSSLVVEDKEILNKYIKYEGSGILEDKYKKGLKSALGKDEIENIKSPRVAIKKAIKKEIEKDSTLINSPQKIEKLEKKMQGDPNLFYEWVKEQFNNFLERKYFCNEAKKDFDEKDKNDKAVMACIGKVIVVNGDELTAGKGKASPIYYGENKLKGK